MIVKPIFTGTINNRPIRFFKSPRPELGPQFPWHSHEDLTACLELPEAARGYFHQRTAALGAPDVQSVATAKGIVLIASHSVAQGLIGAALECNPPTKLIDDAEWQYTQAGVAASNAVGMTLEEMFQAVKGERK